MTSIHVLWIAGGLGLILVTLAAFSTGLSAGFVSDSWIFIHRAHLPAHTLIEHLIPSNDAFYRPIIEVAFWIEWRLFGLNPVPYHLAALTGHAASSFLVGSIVWHLTRSRPAALTASLTFLFSIHAHEVVFDIADLHNAMGGVLLFGAVLAFMRGRAILPAVLAALLFLVDETALLLMPLAILYGAMFEHRSARIAARRVAPLMAVTIGYLASRFAGGGFANEVVDQCTSGACLLAGAGQYFDRLFLRPDVLISREAPTLLIAAVILGIALLFKPWRWLHGRTVAFGVGWVVGTGFFFILALWPYIADRFLYIPGAGVAIVAGAFIAEAVRRTREGHTSTAAALVGSTVVMLWIAVGAVTLNARGTLWAGAGDRAASILAQVVAVYPNPTSGAVMSFRGVPHSFAPVIPPGNTGAYVFHNGLPQALAIVYGRNDITVVEDLPAQPLRTERSVYRLAIYTSGLVVVDPEFE